MILKIKNMDNTWNYYEGDSINQRKTIPQEEVGGEPIYLIDTDRTLRICIYIEKERKITNRIVTNRPTYLLNDNGKTIDKLI